MSMQRLGGTNNLSCLLVLPPHRGTGYTQLMIALSTYTHTYTQLYLPAQSNLPHDSELL